MTKRLTEKEFIDRINYLWEKFHDRPEMSSISYEDFKRECFEEFEKQNRMSDDELDIYRKKSYNKLIKETDKLTTKEEREKLNNQDNQTITIQDEMKFKKGEDMVNGNKNL